MCPITLTQKIKDYLTKQNKSFSYYHWRSIRDGKSPIEKDVAKAQMIMYKPFGLENELPCMFINAITTSELIDIATIKGWL